MTIALKLAILPVSIALLWTCAATSAARAATPVDSAKTTAKATVSTRMMSDSDFAKAAAQGGLAEVKLGQLAEDRGSSQQVKDFGKRMVNDHSNVDESLKTTVSKENIAVPTQLSAKDQAVYDRLSKLSGNAFDHAYARDMVRDHVADITAFRHEANDGKDASIKTFASETLPTLQAHLKQAREMLHSVSAVNSGSTNKEKS